MRLGFGGFEAFNSRLDGLRSTGGSATSEPISQSPVAGRASARTEGVGGCIFPFSGEAGRAYYSRVKVRVDAMPDEHVILLKFASDEASWSEDVPEAGACLRADGRLVLAAETGEPLTEGSGAQLVEGGVYLVELSAVAVAGTDTEPPYTSLSVRVNGLTQLSARDPNGQGVVNALYLPTAPHGGTVAYDDWAVNDDRGVVNNSWCGNGSTVVALPDDSALGTMPPRGRNIYHAGGNEQVPLDGVVARSLDLGEVAPGGSLGLAAGYATAAVASSKPWGSEDFEGMYGLSLAGGPQSSHQTFGHTISFEGVKPKQFISGQDGHGGPDAFRGPPHPEEHRWAKAGDLRPADLFQSQPSGPYLYWADPPSWTWTPEDIEPSIFDSWGSLVWNPAEDSPPPAVTEGGGLDVTVQVANLSETAMQCCLLAAMADFTLPMGYGLTPVGLQGNVNAVAATVKREVRRATRRLIG